MGPSVLIVEDSTFLALYLKRALEAKGYEVIDVVSSGEACLERLVQLQRPSVILMDILLSGTLDGIETATIIQEAYRIPVVYMTGLADKETIQRAKITTPYGYLTKPFKEEEMERVIEMVLHKHEMEKQLEQKEEQFYAILNSISDAVISVDTDLNIVYANPSAEHMTGFQKEELLGKGILEVLHFYTACEGEYNPLQSVCRSERHVLEQRWLQSKQGNEICIGEGSVSAIVDANGHPKGLVLTFKDVSERMERERSRVENEKDRLRALLDGQEKERARIARDLHDGLGQLLNAIKMKTNMVLEDGKKAESLFQLLDEALLETKRISENLLPSKLRDFDLSVCLKSLCKQMDAASPISISFDSFGGPSPLNELQKVNLYRIAQEGITNAMKHGESSYVHVQLNAGTDVLQLTIEDDGVGMKLDVKDIPKHGLLNIRDRTKVMDGRLSIDSDEKRGTILMIEVPLID